MPGGIWPVHAFCFGHDHVFSLSAWNFVCSFPPFLLHTPGPVPFATCVCYNVDTILYWTCHFYGPFWVSNIPRYFCFAFIHFYWAFPVPSSAYLMLVCGRQCPQIQNCFKWDIYWCCFCSESVLYVIGLLTSGTTFILFSRTWHCSSWSCKDKKMEIWPSPMTKAPIPTEMSKGQSDNTNNATKKFD